MVEFVDGLDLRDATLAGESLGGALSLSASVDLKHRVSRVVAFNSYDYPEGGKRGNATARIIMTLARIPVIGPPFSRVEPESVLRDILLGGYVDSTKLPADFVSELSRNGRRAGYPRVSRAIFPSLEGFDRARERYPRVSVPVTLVYSESDWSRPGERDRVGHALTDVHRLTIPRTGHFSALENPDAMARILLDAA